MASPTITSSSTMNQFAYYWRYKIGQNNIPADTINKKPLVSWLEWQDKPIPEELHNQWKEQGMFSKGIAIIPGRVWHREDKKDQYFTFLDADKLKAINELLSKNGKTATLQEMSQKFLIEQHKDNQEKAHIYFYSPIPFPQKTPDSILGLEVKGMGKHGIAFCSPSIHQQGQPYEIIGTSDPITLTVEQANEFIQHIDSICKKYGVEYLDKHYTKVILDSDTKIYEGTRHRSMISITDRLLFKYLDKGKTEEQIKQMVKDINNTRCVPLPLPDREIEDIFKDALDYVRKRKQEEQEEEGQRQQQQQQQTRIGGNLTNYKAVVAVDKEEEQLAAENKLTTEDIDFVINTIKKEARYDELSIKQLFYGMASAFTKLPIPHIVNSKEAGTGKSYLLNLVSSYFPNKYVIVLSGMSAKALFHKRGVLVIQNKETGDFEPIAPMIEPLQSQIDDIENKIIDEMDNKEPKDRNKKQIKDWKKRIRELESEIRDFESRAEKLIQLDNQIIICLDTPEPSVYDALMSIISQDTERDQQYSFVDKSGISGKLGTKDNILRGTPALFTSQVIDDTRTQRFAEKNRRFININPDTSSQKIRAANNIIGLKHGFLPEEYDEIVVSRSDKEKAKQIVKIVIAKLKQHTKHLGPKEDGVKIPFALSITNSIPDGHVWSMTITDRTIKYLGIITKVNMDARPRLVNEQTGQFFPIATFEDLKETLKLMQVGASGARPYIVNWYNKVFVPAIKDLGGKPYEKIETGDDGKTILGVDGKSVIIDKERHIGVNTEQLALKTKEVFKGAKPSNKELRDKYLEPLVNLGVLDKVQSEIDKRENIYLPVEEGSLFHIFDDDNDLKIKVSNELFPSKNILKEQFRTFVKKNADGVVVFERNFSYYKLMDAEALELSLDQLLDRYFANPDDCFVKIEDKREEYFFEKSPPDVRSILSKI
jgi:hypothetical protein